MSVVSIGDQARAFVLQSASHRLKTTVTTLAAELASGQVADLPGRLNGNTREVASISSRLALLNQLQTNAKEAASLTKGMTDVLENVRTTTLRLSTSLITLPNAHSASAVGVSAAEAENAFQQVVSNLNTAAGNRFLLSGVESDVAPLIPADDMLDTLQGLVAGQSTAADVAQIVADWFDSPTGGGGFMDVAYHGSVTGDRVMQIAEGKDLRVGLTASSASLREQLKGLATAALVERGVLAGNSHEQQNLLATGGKILIDSSAMLVADMGRIGLHEQNASQAQAENASAIATLTTLNNTIREADPAATAAAITEAETQLQALYSVTARLADLNLVSYLR